MVSKLIYIFILIVASACLRGQTMKYNINDPRNPDCPCHKYQKLADQEYQQLLAMNNKNVGRNNNPLPGNSDKINDHNNKTAETQASEGKKTASHFLKHKRKRKTRKHNSFKRFFESSHWDFLKGNPITDACFKWR